MRDSCFVALITISRAMAARLCHPVSVEIVLEPRGALQRICECNVAVWTHEVARVAREARAFRTLTPGKDLQLQPVRRAGRGQLSCRRSENVQLPFERLERCEIVRL